MREPGRSLSFGPMKGANDSCPRKRQPRRMTVDEFESSDLYDDNRVELIDGQVSRKDEMKPAHMLAVELVKREVHSSPKSDGYGIIRVYKPGDQLPVNLDGVEVGQIDVTDILPGARPGLPSGPDADGP